jgi:hypothetical protein
LAVHSHNDFAASTFTAPSACQVLVIGSLYVSAGTTGNEIVAIFKNGTEHKWVSVRPSVASNTSAPIYAVVNCAAGDTLDIRYFSANSRGLSGAQKTTFVSYTILP